MDMLTDEYRLLRRLGSGGMGEVWEAARIKDNHVVVPCAIKLLHADFTATARERRLFHDEARIATQLDHSRIVKVIDVGTARDGRPFLVMERVDGIDLRSFLKEAEKESLVPLEIDITTYIVGEVLAALDYAHERTIGGAEAGIIHSDVTPGNILISSSGEVKLTDFGIARFAATAAPMSRAIGTPRYMSPEQLSGDPRIETDIYGLGVVLHEMLDGRRFLEGCTPDQFRSRVLMGPPPELERSDVPEWLDELRRRMIATDRRDRPRASEARAVLIEHCPRYLAAGEQLKNNYYARLIGRRRSGVTQLLARADARYTPGLLPQIAKQEGAGAEGSERSRELPGEETLHDPSSGTGVGGVEGGNSTYTADRAGHVHLGQVEAGQAPAAHDQPSRLELLPEHEDEDDPIDATELLPAAGGEDDPLGRDESVSAPFVPARPGSDVLTPRLRWLAIGSAAAAGVLLITVIVLLVQMFRADEGAVAVAPEAAEGPKVTQEAAEPADEPERARAAQPVPVATPDPVITPEPKPEPEPAVEPGTELEPREEPTGEPAQDSKAEASDEPTKEIEKETKPKPKPKAGPPIGVVFVVERDGEIKVSGKVATTKNHATYLELRPGRHTVRWRAADGDPWQSHGKLTVEDISPGKYQVRLAGGKLTEVKRL
jgi:tRNA A-37 threonylcarbamoyl transferase component Bud32